MLCGTVQTDDIANPVAVPGATVTLKSTDPTATLPGPYAFGPSDVSQHTFQGVTLRKAGTQRLTATDSNGLTEQGPPITVYARGR